MEPKIQNLDPSWSTKRANEAQEPNPKSILVVPKIETILESSVLSAFYLEIVNNIPLFYVILPL
ncbi:hypothetical protein [Heyndrickxia sporothermodurans]|uniref:hypothetical protein n=1 Tax=Heyndrickxia sporothermodurans TaxID=46224 RepID=UPI0011598859|nr:hypothetical protein [Heyndrickxia sporothermodurans]